MLNVIWDAVAEIAENGAFVKLSAPFSTAKRGRFCTMRESTTATFSMSALIVAYTLAGQKNP
jgi:hypothetical protein